MKETGITALDGIAIICIVFYHVVYLYHSLTSNEVPAPFLKLSYVGLILFTASSGFKLISNHQEDIKNKIFLQTYLVKRLVRLLKPYVGYTLLLLPFYYITKSVINFKDPGLTQDTYTYITIAIQFLKGNNIIAPPLWYLFMLSIITVLVFGILYVISLDTFFKTCIPVCVAGMLLYDKSSNILEYGIIFIIGMLLAYFNIQNFLPSLKYRAGNFSNILLFIGTNSFYIYIFHYPTFSIITRLFIYVLHIDQFFITFVITGMTIPLSIVIYRIFKYVGVNRLIE